MAQFSGRAIIAQSGGPSRVINQSLVGAVQEAAKNSEIITSFWGSLHGPEGLVGQRFIDLYAQTILDLEQTANTSSSALGSSRLKIGKDIEPEAVFRSLARNDIRFFFYIGGNDSADNARMVNEIALEHNYELRCFHIPKTVDDDLRVNDHTPGYGSAARYVAVFHQGDNTDNRSLKGVKINVCMGRHAGFLTAAAALARKYKDDGPHLVYLPERPFSVDQFIKDVQRVYKRHGRCVVAISEGVEDAEGNAIGATGETDSHGNVQLSGSGGLGDYLVAVVKDKTGISRVRQDTLGYGQRHYLETVSEQDALEARAVGVEAVRFALPGNVDGSVAIIREEGPVYAVRYALTSFESVAKHTKHMPDEFINRAGNDVTQAFIDYAGPLVGALPVVGRLDMTKKAHR